MRLAASHHRRAGGTLVLSLIVLTLLALMAANTLRRVEPKLRMAYQTVGWQEARVAAEAGIDVAMGELARNATGPNDGAWTGWKEEHNGVVTQALASTLSLVNSLLSLLGGSTKISQPIFLDNLNVSAATGFESAVDVQLWAVYPNGNSNGRWFRIRSMASCALPPPTYTAPDSLDVPLRRYSLRNVRQQLKKDDVGDAMNVGAPSSSRIVEVLVEPILPFELALVTDQELNLATGGTWVVDSYDSRDPQKSNEDGTYPGRNSPKVQKNGSVASNLAPRPGEPYGPLIAARGMTVSGVVATNGGDDPTTPEKENVSGAINLDPTRIRSDFLRDLPPPTRPAMGLPSLPPLLGLPFVAGPEALPTRYRVGGKLSAFTVVGAPGVKSKVIIFVDGDLDVDGGPVVIQPGVTVQIYVRGNVDFHSSQINFGGLPSQLQIFGEETNGNPRTLQANGNASITAAFYGPQYKAMFRESVEWFGAIGARTFEMLGGGTGGIHYDEALGIVGDPISFRIARYVEDVRE
jgi:hypothetical protein